MNGKDFRVKKRGEKERKKRKEDENGLIPTISSTIVRIRTHSILQTYTHVRTLTLTLTLTHIHIHTFSPSLLRLQFN